MSHALYSKYLEKEPHKRYGTAQELADDLSRYLEGRPVVARPIGRIARTWRVAKRNPVVASPFLLVLISLVGGTAVSSSFAVETDRRAAHQAGIAQQARKQTDQALAKEEAAHVHAERAAETVARRQADEALACIQGSQPAQEAEDTLPDTASLLEQLDSETSTQRMKALQALVKQGAEATAAVPQLIAMLNEPDSVEKAWAIRGLGRIGPNAAAAVPKLHEILKSLATDEPKGAKAVPNIGMLLSGKPSVEGIRFEAAGALSRIRPAGEVAIPTLIEMLQDPGESVKTYLKPRKLQAPSAEGYAAMLYRSDDQGTYTDARDLYLTFLLGCLAQFGPAANDAIPAIEALKKDPDTLPLVRHTADEAIKRISADTSEPTENK